MKLIGGGGGGGGGGAVDSLIQVIHRSKKQGTMGFKRLTLLTKCFYIFQRAT